MIATLTGGKLLPRSGSGNQRKRSNSSETIARARPDRRARPRPRPRSGAPRPGTREARTPEPCGARHRGAATTRRRRGLRARSAAPPARRDGPRGPCTGRSGRAAEACARRSARKWTASRMYSKTVSADEVVEDEADEAELDRPRARAAPRPRGRREVVPVEADQPVDVRGGAEAAAARLDPEEVAEERDDEVRVEHPDGAGVSGWRMPKRDDRDARERRGCRAGGGAGSRDHEASARCTKLSSSCRIVLGADRLLEPEGEPGADRLDDRRGCRPPRAPRDRGGSVCSSGVT